MGIWGFYVYKRRQKMISYMGVTSVAVFILLAYVTKDIPLLGKLEVDRFTVPACVFSVLGLALAMGIVYEEMGFRRLRLRYAFPLVFLIIGFLGTNNMLSLSTVSNRLEDSRKPYKELIAWINNNTSTDGRIAFMDRGDFIRTAGLRYFTNRYFINSPFLYMNLKHGYTAFGHDYFSGQDRFMGRRLQDLNGADLGKYFDLFNIKWIITTRDEAHDFFVKFPQQVKLVKEFTMYQKEKPKSIQRDPSDPEDIEGPEAEYPISIFEVNRKPDYFLRGAGNIRVDYDRLWITMASPGEVIIKYHWMETLAVSPPLPIERYFVDGSPIGFIRVHNGATKDFTIYNSYHVGHQ
jgi:hypothetical protein